MADRKIDPGMTLSELIASAANELREAHANRQQPEVMVFKECELELAVKDIKKVGGGFKIYLASANTSLGAETVSRVRLKFAALPGPDGRALAFPAQGQTARPIPVPAPDEGEQGGGESAGTSSSTARG
jgi:hypothetical protein